MSRWSTVSTSVGNPISSGFGQRDADLQALLRSPGGATPEALESIAVAKQIPYWTCTLPIYGPEKVVRAKMEYVQERFAAIAGSTFTQTDLFRIPLSPEQLERAHKVDFGVPNLSTFSIGARSALNPNPTDGHVWFSPIVPRNGESILEFQRFYAENLKEVTGGENLGFLGPITLTNWERSLVTMIMFPISHDPKQNRKIRDAFRRWVKLAAERGWGEYRTAPSFMDEVAAGLALALIGSGAHTQAQEPGVTPVATKSARGEQVFAYWCAPCHSAGPGMPGTQALQAKYGGKLPALLLQRSDLTPTLVAYIVRNGVSVMPFFRKTEISDADLEALGAYIVATAQTKR